MDRARAARPRAFDTLPSHRRIQIAEIATRNKLGGIIENQNSDFVTP
jgi:hypothetical protein